MFLQMTRVLVITQSYIKIKGKEIITMNRNSTNYSNFIMKLPLQFEEQGYMKMQKSNISNCL